MSRLTGKNLRAYLAELSRFGWDYRLVAGWVDGSYQLWVATYTTTGEYAGEALLIFSKSGHARTMIRKGSVECFATRYNLQDKLIFREGCL